MTKFLNDVSDFVSRMISVAAKHSGPRRILQESQVDLVKCSLLEIRTQALDVNVASWDEARCVVQLETRDDRDNDNVSFSMQGAGASLTILSSEKSFYGASLVLRLPSDGNALGLKIRTKDGDVSIVDVDVKSIDAETESGDISIDRGTCEDARLFSRNGDVSARNTAVSNGIDMRSANGDVIR